MSSNDVHHTMVMLHCPYEKQSKEDVYDIFYVFFLEQFGVMCKVKEQT